MEDVALYTVPQINGDASLPRRAGMRSMLPSTWLTRTLRCQYIDAFGRGQETSATLLDWCPAGLLVDVAGAKTLLCWERLVLAELVED